MNTESLLVCLTFQLLLFHMSSPSSSPSFLSSPPVHPPPLPLLLFVHLLLLPLLFINLPLPPSSSTSPPIPSPFPPPLHLPPPHLLFLHLLPDPQCSDPLRTPARSSYGRRERMGSSWRRCFRGTWRESVMRRPATTRRPGSTLKTHPKL